MQIPVPHGHLEASLRNPADTARAAAVVCHPLPTHGGTMHTKAVFRTAQALNDAGIMALRFNFRGVGTSTGTFDRGVGEQDDARAALDWLQEHEPDLPLAMAGFSFGSMVGLNVGARDPRVSALVGLGVPVDMYDFTFLKTADKPILVVQGDEDEFATGARAEEVLAPFGDHITIVRIPGADHYFHDRFDELKDAITDFFLKGAASKALGGLGAAGDAAPDASGDAGDAATGASGDAARKTAADEDGQ